MTKKAINNFRSITMLRSTTFFIVFLIAFNLSFSQDESTPTEVWEPVPKKNRII